MELIMKTLSYICWHLCVALTIFGYERDSITYDWLISAAKNEAYADHIPHFRRLFNTIKVRGFLECGCGYSTKYFLDSCDRVISIEFIDYGLNTFWFNKCLKLYEGCSHWRPILYNADHKKESFDNACTYQCAYHKDYALIDSTYLEELDQFFKAQIYTAYLEENFIDVAFVDAGVYIRGDMVKLLLADKIPVVIAHDTSSDVGSDVNEGLYGWFKVKTPPDYEKIYIPFGCGTTFWVQKKWPHVIASLKNYRNQILRKQQEGNLDDRQLFDFIVELADSP